MTRTSTSSVLLPLAALGLVLAASGGAVAGSMITGAQIKDGTITGVDVKDRSLATADLSRATVTALRGHRGQRGLRGLTGEVRAWAHVKADGTVLASSPGVKVVKSSSDEGTYCLQVPGVDPRTTAPVASLDYPVSATSVTVANKPQGFIEVGTYSTSCSASQIGINTFERTYVASGGQLTETTLDHYDQGFYVVIP